MNRRMLYIVIVLLLAGVIAVFSNGCDAQVAEKGNGETITQEETGEQETVQEPASGNSVLPKEEAGVSQEATEAGKEAPTPDNVGTKNVSITVNCASILDNLDQLDPGKKEVLPAGGVISPTTTVEIQSGDTVFDVLLKVTKDKKIHMEYVSTPLYKSNYIEGIGNIYEIDCGPLSGWMYKVNGVFPNYGCGRYMLEDGDQIEWVYTCDLGRDIGGDWNEQNQ